MSGFSLQLCTPTRRQTFEGVTSFVGADASGQFGLLANHARMLTILDYGLARFRVGDTGWQWLALPGAVLRFHANRLSITARRYVLGTDTDAIQQALEQQLADEERRLGNLRQHLQQLEREMLRKLWEMERR